MINVGNHLLRPNTAGQTIDINVASGGQPVQGVTLNLQVADGYPDVGGSTIDGPNITAATVIGTGTIFAGNNTGNNTVPTDPKPGPSVPRPAAGS